MKYPTRSGGASRSARPEPAAVWRRHWCSVNWSSTISSDPTALERPDARWPYALSPRSVGNTWVTNSGFSHSKNAGSASRSPLRSVTRYSADRYLNGLGSAFLRFNVHKCDASQVSNGEVGRKIGRDGGIRTRDPLTPSEFRRFFSAGQDGSATFEPAAAKGLGPAVSRSSRVSPFQ